MQPPVQPQKEPQVKSPIKTHDQEAPVMDLVIGEFEPSSISYTCLDAISFDNFVLPRFNSFGGIDGTFGHEQEHDEEMQHSSIASPMRGLSHPVQTEIPTKPRSRTLKIIGHRDNFLTPTGEDPKRGATISSDARELPASLNFQNREAQLEQGSSSIGSGSRHDPTRSMLYNWHILRMDNIRILDPLWEGFRGSFHDYELLKLLAQTHEHQRWWLIVVDDFACPECVESLKYQRVPTWPLGRALRSLKSRCTRHAHCDGSRCKISCTHTSEDCNNVTRFFSKIGKENSNRMRNIVLETREDQVPDADVLVSVAHNVGLYFPDIQNLEINFHFGDRHLDRDVWTRILCACRRLEHYLPKGQHLRIRGIEKHTELQNDWTRKGRKWHE